MHDIKKQQAPFDADPHVIGGMCSVNDVHVQPNSLALPMLACVNAFHVIMRLCLL